MAKNKIKLLIADDLVNWGSPKVLATGAKDILLHGNPGEFGNYVFRFQLPKHFEIQPFILTSLCFLTIIKGEILIGEGNQFIKNSMSTLPVHGFCCIPANSPIYFLSNEESILQFSGVGPIDIQYINPKDDPRNQIL